MNRLIITLSLMAVAFLPINGQKVVTLRQCYDSVAVNAPQASEKDLLSQISHLKDKNISSNYLPSVDLSGSYMYNSDVVDLSNIMGFLSTINPNVSIPEIPHDTYRGTIDVSQLIWDGGVTRSAREVEQTVLDLNLQQNEADVYKLREQVNNYYFSVLLTDKQAEIAAVLLSELDARINAANSAVTNGVMLKTNLDVLVAEKLKTEQSLSDLKLRREALIYALASLTGDDGINNATLQLPQPVINYDNPIDNPDMKLFDLRKSQFEANKNLLKAQRMPRIFSTATVGYGRPQGNNMLSADAGSYYSFGVGLRWNIFDWHKSSNDRQSLTLQQQITDTKRAATEEGLQRVLRIKRAEIESLILAEATDSKLIEIRTSVSASAASQFENGTITATDYLTELNAEKQVRLNAELHRINLIRTRIEYMNITGQEIE
ncbi:MAG TPA: TolC family protein [Bacteroidales bacterium]|nr:TolC family protein [Bacteroidales bacterium]HPT11589.1 TolC family protein [Bacteroidales bacterium]